MAAEQEQALQLMEIAALATKPKKALKRNCPTCLVLKGQPCIRDGRWSPQPHAARIGLATGRYR